MPKVLELEFDATDSAGFIRGAEVEVMKIPLTDAVAEALEADLKAIDASGIDGNPTDGELSKEIVLPVKLHLLFVNMTDKVTLGGRLLVKEV